MMNSAYRTTRTSLAQTTSCSTPTQRLRKLKKCNMSSTMLGRQHTWSTIPVAGAHSEGSFNVSLQLSAVLSWNWKKDTMHLENAINAESWYLTKRVTNMVATTPPKLKQENLQTSGLVVESAGKECMVDCHDVTKSENKRWVHKCAEDAARTQSSTMFGRCRTILAKHKKADQTSKCMLWHTLFSVHHIHTRLHQTNCEPELSIHAIVRCHVRTCTRILQIIALAEATAENALIQVTALAEGLGVIAIALTKIVNETLPAATNGTWTNTIRRAHVHKACATIP